MSRELARSEIRVGAAGGSRPAEEGGGSLGNGWSVSSIALQESKVRAYRFFLAARKAVL
jgi:hypothetical protein